MENKDFCHLHVHTMYSILDGFGTPEAYAKRASESGFTHLAITDHMNVDGSIKFQKACEANGIKPVIGCEAYMVPDILIKEKGEKRYHITLLVKNAIGWKNMLQLLTKANLAGFYYRARIDPSLLLEHCEGLVIMTACSSSFLHMENVDEFLPELLKKTEVIGEIMPLMLDEQYTTNALVFQKALDYGINLVATNDTHYIEHGQDKLQEVLLAMQTKKRWKDEDRWRFTVNDLYLKTADEMVESFKTQDLLDEETVSDAIFNTIVVADLCEFRIEPKLPTLPNVYAPKYKNLGVDEQLTSLVLDGLVEKAEHHDWIKSNIKEYEERIKEELSHIMPQFTKYFLVVWELISWCKENNILTGGRGSSAGSLVCYCLGITRLDPIKHGLIFSRFISEGRIDLPDIDMDFEDRRRDEVKQHLEDTYGKWSTIEVSTFLTLHGRGALRDVGRVFDVPLIEVDKAAKAIVVRCVDGNTKVWTTYGPIAIKYLVGWDNLSISSIFGSRRVTKEVTDVFSSKRVEMFRVELESGKQITCSAEHKFWAKYKSKYNGKVYKKVGWRKLSELNLETDEILTAEFEEVYTFCNNCRKIIYKHRKHDRKNCSLSCTTKYRNKHFNPMKNPETKAKMIDSKKGVKPKWMDDPEKMGPYVNRLSKRIKENNPMHNEKTRRKHQKTLLKVMPKVANRPENIKLRREIMLKRLDEDPDCHPLRLLAKRKRKGVARISYFQDKLSLAVKIVSKRYGLSVEDEWPITYYKKAKFKNKRRYYLDVAIPALKIDFEYDGKLHLNLKTYELERDLLLNSKNWKVFRFKHKDVIDAKRLTESIERIISHEIRENKVDNTSRETQVL